MSSRRIEQAVAAMLACIVECPDLTILGPGHYDTLFQDFVGNEIPGRAQLIHVRNEMPAAKENAQPLLLKDGRVIEERGLEGPSRRLFGFAPLDRHCTTSGGAACASLAARFAIAGFCNPAGIRFRAGNCTGAC
jgi:hypothetical protein